MSSHRAASRSTRRRIRRPVWRSTRVRAGLSLGVVLCLGATGTLAYWTDEATISGGPFTSGTLDLTAGPTTGAENLSGTGPNSWTVSDLTLTNMIPGDSVSKTVVLRNSGNAPFRVNGVVTTTTNDLVATTAAQGLQVVIVDGATATTPTTDTNGVRTGGCTTGTAVHTSNPTTTSTTAIYATPPSLTSGQTRSVCVRAILPAAAPNALQTKTTTVRLAMTATQLGAP
jgi:predicted ribosomally synthesized peptide with SipW-like signal peptide